MKGSISRLSILCCFLLDSRWTITHYFSDAFTIESRAPFSNNDGTDTTQLFGQTSNVEFDSSRRSMLKLVPLAGMTLLGSPAIAEVDPFAAMDDMLSGGLPAAVSSPGNSTASGTSDMAAALQESKKRRTIDPRTHG